MPAIYSARWAILREYSLKNKRNYTYGAWMTQTIWEIAVERIGLSIEGSNFFCCFWLVITIITIIIIIIIIELNFFGTICIWSQQFSTLQQFSTFTFTFIHFNFISWFLFFFHFVHLFDLCHFILCNDTFFVRFLDHHRRVAVLPHAVFSIFAKTTTKNNCREI